MITGQHRAAYGYMDTKDSILSVYVWDFEANSEDLKELSGWLTDDFEREIIESGRYKVLERRNFNRVMAHQRLESRISAVENLNAADMENLKAIEAEAVFFGELKFDSDSGEYEVSVILQKMDGELLRNSSILIKKAMIRDNTSRKEYMESLVQELHGKEIILGKARQYEIISIKLKSYLNAIETVALVYKDLESIPIQHGEYFMELETYILEYNDIRNELNNNSERYLDEFGRYWDRNRTKELETILTYIEEDIHRPYVFNGLNEVRTLIMQHNQEPNKGRKKALREKLNNKTKEIISGLTARIDNVDQKIDRFLIQLRDESSG
jgi:hypothetical protein